MKFVYCIIFCIWLKILQNLADLFIFVITMPAKGTVICLDKNKKARLFGSVGLVKVQDFEYKDNVLVKNNTDIKPFEVGMRYDF